MAKVRRDIRDTLSELDDLRSKKVLMSYMMKDKQL